MLRALSMSRASVLGCLLVCAAGARADQFDDHKAEVVSKVADAKGVRKVPSLPAKALGALPHPLPEHASSTFIIVKTDEGNWTKALIRDARQRIKEVKDPVPLVLVERLVTYPAHVDQRIFADEKNKFLFDGFGIDLDLGQVVPKGMGEDLRFVVDANGGRLETVGDAQMYLVAKSLLGGESAAKEGTKEEAPPRKTSQGGTEPSDFSGKYRLEADGRWAGELILKADDQGSITGSYKSDETGRTYDVRGQVGNPNNRIAFEVVLPMTIQKFEGYLWTHDHNKITGVTLMLDRPFGFLATRGDES